MKIAHILAAKGTKARTIGHNQNFGSILPMMHDAQIGSMVVVHAETGALLGIISQPEILAALTKFGVSSLSHCVTDLMRKPISTCTMDDDIRSIMAQMTHERCRHIVVTSADSAILGVVSLGDLVAAQLQETRLEANVLRDIARSHIMATAA